MEKLIVIILLVANPQTVQAQGDTQMFSLDEKLRGPVRSISVEKAGILRVEGKLVEGSRVKSQESYYNSQGQKRTEINYDSDGKISVKKIFSYDPKNQLSEVAEHSADGSLVNRRVYTHKGDSIEEVTYRSGGTPRSGKTVNKLDSAGRQIGIETGGEEPFPMKAAISYRDGGKVVEIAMCAPDVKAVMLVPGGDGTTVVLSDDAKAQMKGRAPCFDGLLTSKTVLTLDDTGHIAEAAIYTPDNSLIGREFFTREYDFHGNWIKETRSRWNSQTTNSEPTEVIYRIIKYF